MGKKYTDARNLAEQRFNPSDHEWVFSVAVSKQLYLERRDEPRRKKDIYAYARQFAYCLDEEISDLYKEDCTYSHVISGPLKDGVPVSVSTLIGPLEKVVAVASVYIELLNIHEDDPKTYVPIAFVDIGTDDLSKINRFLRYCHDQLVLLRLLEIESAQTKHYALLTEPKKAALVTHLTDEAVLKKLASLF